MRTTRRIVLIATCVGSLFAGPLKQQERDRAQSELQATRKQFLDAIEGLSPAQWNFKPDAKTWSVAECAEHIALSEDVIFGMVRGKLMSAPPVDSRPEGTIKDEDVLKRLTDRSQKAQAPETLQPKRKWATREELAGAFRASRDRTLDYVRTTGDDLRSRYGKHPVGNLDAYQWLLLISAHSERHVLQLLEVKASAGFPKR
jgi:uncharacterized damage-inducible protein DinB